MRIVENVTEFVILRHSSNRLLLVPLLARLATRTHELQAKVAPLKPLETPFVAPIAFAFELQHANYSTQKEMLARHAIPKFAAIPQILLLA